MKWSPLYSTGLANIDEQHQMLFRMSEDYRASLVEGRGDRVYALLLESLEQYARAHFGLEDACMYRYQCPAAAINSQAHERFVETLGTFRRRYAEHGFSESDALRLVDFVDGWLASHIARIDTQLNRASRRPGKIVGVSRTLTAQSDVGWLARVLVKHPKDAFRDAEQVSHQWRDLDYAAPPDIARASNEFDRFAAALRECGADLLFLPPDPETTLDSIYVRDATVVCDRGIVFCRMGKPRREGEPDAQARALRTLGVDMPVLGRIEPPGRLEGGDVVWLDRRTLAIGRGYRTNDDGIRQLAALLGNSVDELIVVPLPHWRGPSDVMHLMSLISPVDRDLAVVYSPLLPVPFRQRLLELGLTLVEVPDEEFETMGTNVLALAPRQCLMLAGNPATREALEGAGARVLDYTGDEISVKGAGGPTCLTRPLYRADAAGPPHAQSGSAHVA